MDTFRTYLPGLVTFLPVLLIQVLIAFAGARRWPRFRWAFTAMAAIPFFVWLLGYPPFHARFPGQLVFVIGFWIYAAVPAYLIYWIAHGAGKAFVPQRRDLLRNASLVAAAAPCAVLLYGTFFERTEFRVTQVSIPLASLPPGLDGLRLLQISDIHRSAFLSHRELVRVVDMAREVPADIVLHTGDFISSWGDPIDECLQELARVHGDRPAVGCLGNHEIYAHVQAYATAQAAKLGIDILRSRTRQFQRNGSTLNIAGVDYQHMGSRAHYLIGAESLLTPGAFNLLLSHNPDVFPVAVQKGFDLTISGHTHGGQLRFELGQIDVDLAEIYTPFTRGLYRFGSSCGYVTRGIGTIGIPSRIGAPPEISLITLKRA